MKIRAFFKNDFERMVAKAARKHCDNIFRINGWIGYWLDGDAFYSTWDLYDALIERKRIKPFSNDVIDKALGIDNE